MKELTSCRTTTSRTKNATNAKPNRAVNVKTNAKARTWNVLSANKTSATATKSVRSKLADVVATSERGGASRSVFVRLAAT